MEIGYNRENVVHNIGPMVDFRILVIFMAGKWEIATFCQTLLTSVPFVIKK
jgi:hypothetical protein